jgi:hypothetical protein
MPDVKYVPIAIIIKQKDILSAIINFPDNIKDTNRIERHKSAIAYPK